MSATAGGQEGTATQTGGNRLGFKPGMVIQELGWDEDVDDDLRVQIENTVDGDLVDGEYGNVVDAVILWWRDDDGDLTDALMDALTDLVGGGVIWLLTPKVGRPGAVDAADIAEAAPVAGLATTTTAKLKATTIAKRARAAARSSVVASMPTSLVSRISSISLQSVSSIFRPLTSAFRRSTSFSRLIVGVGLLIACPPGWRRPPRVSRRPR